MRRGCRSYDRYWESRPKDGIQSPNGELVIDFAELSVLLGVIERDEYSMIHSHTRQIHRDEPIEGTSGIGALFDGGQDSDVINLYGPFERFLKILAKTA